MHDSIARPPQLICAVCSSTSWHAKVMYVACYHPQLLEVLNSVVACSSLLDFGISQPFRNILTRPTMSRMTCLELKHMILWQIGPAVDGIYCGTDPTHPAISSVGRGTKGRPSR
jgi:hypothetical protein